MRIHLLSVGRRMPAWVAAGYDAYAKRLPRECSLHLVEIEPGRRRRGERPALALRDEEARLTAALPRGARTVALDERGTAWSTAQLANALSGWMADGRDLALLVGGPDGLPRASRSGAERIWSLSPLTFPHQLVRVLVAEQLYRAWSILQGHPYHRA